MQTTKFMGKINTLETTYETFLRTRAEEICKTYLGWSHEIMTGQVKPNRIIQNIAKAKGLTGEGVKKILKRCGIYKSAEQPLIIKRTEPTQLSMFGAEQPISARV